MSSQVRELLFAYSIGQRVFGEAVLNLSQGTVSEILSKPRPWHSLSVKGREPYIRMYTWYNDTGNVQKLLAWKRERDGKLDIFTGILITFLLFSITTFSSSSSKTNSHNR